MYICERMLHSHSKPSNTQDHPPHHITSPPHTHIPPSHIFYPECADGRNVVRHINTYAYPFTQLYTQTYIHMWITQNVPTRELLMPNSYTHSYTHSCDIHTPICNTYPHSYKYFTHTYIGPNSTWCLHTFIHTFITSNALTRPAHTKSIHTFIKTYIVRAHIPTHIDTHIL